MMAATTRRGSSLLLLNLSKSRPLLACRASARAYASSPSSSAPASSSGSAGVSDHTPSPQAKNKKPWSFLKFGVWGSITACAALAGYATAAYSLEEIDEKTAALRSPVSYTAGDEASSLDKIQAVLSSAVLTVPAKCVELYMDVRRSIEEHVKGFTDPSSEKLLPDLLPQEQHVFTLVLDLNETLIYSDWKRERGWRTFKRPGVDAFLEHLAQFYEIVVYSDQLSMYVDPILERLDGKGCIRYRLSRAATRYVNGKHYRDLSKLNRDPSRVMYISGHALESSLQPENSIQIKPWKLESDDTALLDLIPFLEF
ncbi:mitochondrial import inner membrane translocase subunit TIM50 isoform X2 [Nymphaea colorata]|uniref:mitochondrial import inner membrane translocase subunit TIM50 isoform X2 n=1 Tax=Nymphaea colorata TaxID=210225 RepID=UPI00214EBCAB|nr:mitochondrial import inner membrane translocase subunit TIM50 isoform X2 [Nymphaea colorata]